MLDGSLGWREEGGVVAPYLLDDPEQPVVWAPQPGSQELFLSCPVTEVIYEGNRGGGKTLCLLMDFAQHVDQGFGSAWRGILFRREFTQLKDVIDKSIEWFPRLWPAAKYNRSEHVWNWPSGEKLFFAHMDREEDYHAYHGWGLCWIGWEELTNWPAHNCYLKMFSTLRSSHPTIPRKVRATTNPAGPGHNWVKHRFGLPIAPHRRVGPIIKDAESGIHRVAIKSRLAENKILTVADPEYITRIKAGAANPHELKAWLEGSWDIVAGGMFDDLWDPAIHVVPAIPMKIVPSTWRMDRSYDDGQTKPFSIGWWAQSSGEPITIGGRVLGQVRGDIFRLQELYGWNGKPNEGLKMASRDIAKAIAEREVLWGVGTIDGSGKLRSRVKGGPADANIWNADPRDPGQTIAGDMEKLGVNWEKANKRPGSRKQGWAQIRQMLKFAKPENGRREYPGLFVSEVCTQFLRCFPVTQRDPKDPDDVDTETEDHIADEVRYRCLRPRAVEKPVAFLPY